MELIRPDHLVRKRILVVDDDPIIHDILSEILEQAGFHVAIVSEGCDVTETAWREQPDLMILDCALPDKSGMTILSEFRASPTFCNLPIIMLTSRSSEWAANTAMTFGATAFIRKPFSAGELVVAVTKHINQVKVTPV